MTSSPPKRLRVLALHGMRVSGSILADMMSDIRQAFSDLEWQWVFVDAPLDASGPTFDLVAQHWPGEPYYEWWNATQQPDGTVKYVGLDQSLDFIRQTLADRGPFDLLAGYSQGCILSTILTAMTERQGPVQPNRPWRGVMLFNSGPPPRDPRVLPLLEGGPLQTSSIHVLGGPTDVVYQGQKAMLELWSADSRTVLEHDEGHIPPTTQKSPHVIEQLREAAVGLFD
jgi:hypothetical protein